VLVTVLALGAFQVLAIVGAGVASAAGTCNYVLASQRIDVVINTGTASTLAVSDGTVAGTVNGDILFDGAACGGSPKITNTVQVNVTTTVPSGTETFTIDNTFGAPDREFPNTIAWFVDLGTGTGDLLNIFGADQTANVVVLTNGGFTLDGATGTTAGVELVQVIGNAGNDSIDGSALTSAVQLFAAGGAGDDTIAPGAAGALPLPGDFLDGGVGSEVNGDTLDYHTRTTSVVIDSANFTSGHSANADCDVLDPGDELDTQFNFENLQTGSGNDCIIGNAGVFEYFIPGDGDDGTAAFPLVGQIGQDTIDWSSSSALMLINPTSTCGGTATGQGTDVWTGVNMFVGSAFDDVLTWNNTCPTAAFSGGDGVDTVDATAQTTSLNINLDNLDPTNDDLENLLGGSGNDVLTGNDIRNQIEGNDGNDDLTGREGNDTLIGGLGNDDFQGDAGADKVSYETNAVSGVNVDVVLGFGTSSESGDDSFTDAIEIITGSPFNDSITGGGGLTTTNFLFTGGNGKDILTGSGSNDTLKGGKGNDKLRGLEGGDTLKGGKGSNDKGWGGPGVDFCTGIEVERGCE
jgi:hypothetical protein